MRRGRRSHRILLATLAVAGLALAGLLSCGGGNARGEEAARGGGGEGNTLTVLAASSLTEAFGELAGRFEKRNPGVTVKTSFGASSQVLAQIRQGAPADVFASADAATMDEAAESGLLDGEPRVFARNRLTIVVPEGNPGGIRAYEDLARPGLRLVLAEDEVPVARYARESLEKAGGEYGDDFRRKVYGNVVSREANVRAGVNRVALGDADATFGYASDVTPDVEGRVETVEIPPDLNVIAAYPIAVLGDAESPGLAREWVDLAMGEEGRSVLEKWGFEPAA